MRGIPPLSFRGSLLEFLDILRILYYILEGSRLSLSRPRRLEASRPPRHSSSRHLGSRSLVGRYLNYRLWLL